MLSPPLEKCFWLGGSKSEGGPCRKKPSQPPNAALAPEAPGQPPSGLSPATQPEQWRRLRFGERLQPIMGEPDLLASERPCSRSWGFGIGTASMEVLAQEGALMYQELLAKQLQKWPLAFGVPL